MGPLNKSIQRARGRRNGNSVSVSRSVRIFHNNVRNGIAMEDLATPLRASPLAARPCAARQRVR